MAKLSPHFNDSEFRCRHCKKLKKPPQELLTLLELVRCHFGKPVHITSGYRCRIYNNRIGGSKRSKHMYGKAVDFYIHGVNTKLIYAFLDSIPSARGLGLYNTWIHADTRNAPKARWRG